MLYTTYLGNMERVPAGVEKRLIMRLPPAELDLKKHADLIHTPELSPSKSLLLQTKESGDWGFYVIRFTREMKNREDMRQMLDTLLERLKAGEDICLICCEADYRECHRSLLAQWFVERGIAWTEVERKSKKKRAKA